MKNCQIYTDGGTRGKNPGVSACGFVLMESGYTVVEAACLLDGITSNNESEYGGVVMGLFNAAARGYTHVDLFTDSQLVANQMTGKFQVNSAVLKECVEEARIEESKFEVVRYTWIPRAQNARADRVVRDLLDEEMARRKDDAKR